MQASHPQTPSGPLPLQKQQHIQITQPASSELELRTSNPLAWPLQCLTQRVLQGISSLRPTVSESTSIQMAALKGVEAPFSIFIFAHGSGIAWHSMA